MHAGMGTRPGVWWAALPTAGMEVPTSLPCVSQSGEGNSSSHGVLCSSRLLSFCLAPRGLRRSFSYDLGGASIPIPPQSSVAPSPSSWGAAPCSLKEHSKLCTFAGLCQCPWGQRVHQGHAFARRQIGYQDVTECQVSASQLRGCFEKLL